MKWARSCSGIRTSFSITPRGTGRASTSLEPLPIVGATGLRGGFGLSETFGASAARWNFCSSSFFATGSGLGMSGLGLGR